MIAFDGMTLPGELMPVLAPLAWAVPAIAVLIGMVSALLYLRRRRWIDAALVLVAALALATLLGQFKVPGGSAADLAVSMATTAAEAGAAARLTVVGDGLRAAEWRDLPARPLQWPTPTRPRLQLDFPRRIALGRMFALTVTRAESGSARLQLLAENGQVLAEAAGSERQLQVQWLPPVAEALTLQARLQDATGRTIAQGPIPIDVHDAVPLQVQARLHAPSFDAMALNRLLAAGHANLDWQVMLGKTVIRTETRTEARTEHTVLKTTQPDLLVVDAAYFETMSVGARAALLMQVAAGARMVVLAGNAANPTLWASTVQLPLKAQPGAAPDTAAGTAPDDIVGHAAVVGTTAGATTSARRPARAAAQSAPLTMAVAPFNPATENAGAWHAVGDRIWTRDWQKGRIAWVGVTDWHRHAITEPQALASWWQQVLDRSGVQREQDVLWETPQDMPLPGLRTEICARGAVPDPIAPAAVQSAGRWLARPDKADAACMAIWPAKSGWLRLTAQGRRPQTANLYVYSKQDWPDWQAAQRRAATLAYAARTPDPVRPGPAQVLASWPGALVLMVAMLLLWWRERR